MNKKLLVIGNGFDINMGLKTSYIDFLEWLKQNDESLHEWLDTESNDDLWGNFEENLIKIIQNSSNSELKTIIEEIKGRTKNVFDVIMSGPSPNTFLKTYIESTIEKVNILKIKMVDFIYEQSLNYSIHIGKEIKNDYLIFNFNYTEVANKVFEGSEVINIHGTIAKYEEIKSYSLYRGKPRDQRRFHGFINNIIFGNNDEHDIINALVGLYKEYWKVIKADEIMNFQGFFSEHVKHFYKSDELKSLSLKETVLLYEKSWEIYLTKSPNAKRTSNGTNESLLNEVSEDNVIKLNEMKDNMYSLSKEKNEVWDSFKEQNKYFEEIVIFGFSFSKPDLLYFYSMVKRTNRMKIYYHTKEDKKRIETVIKIVNRDDIHIEIIEDHKQDIW